MGNILSRIQEIASNEGITIGAMERTIGASKGVLSRAINNGTDIQAKWLSIIVENYPRYSTGWLLTGAGSMLKDDLNGIKTIDEANPSFMPTTSMNPSVGTPYYDVDFIGGFDEVFNSQVNIPATNIVIRGFEKASLWSSRIGVAFFCNPCPVASLYFSVMSRCTSAMEHSTHCSLRCVSSGRM